MAMNKAERAHLEQLETELAFRWPTSAEPEPQEVPNLGKETEGWSFNEYSSVVKREWSTSNAHGGYHQGKRTSGSQGCVRLYRTEADAALALRWAMCRSYARRLRAVDLNIAGAST